MFHTRWVNTCFAAAALAQRTDPQAAKQRGFPLHQQDFSAAGDQRHAHIHGNGRLRRCADGQHVGVLVCAGVAPRVQRAVRAVGRSGNAERSADIHQRLIPVAGALPVDVLPGQTPDFPPDGGNADVLPYAVHAADHARQVAVDGGIGQAEGDGADGRRRVVAHAGQGAHNFIGCRDNAVIFMIHDSGRPVQVPRAGIIAEAFPQLQDLLLVGFGERPHGGKALEKAVVITGDRFGAGLLQHDFGHPDGVGIARAAEGERSLVPLIPGQKLRIGHDSLHAWDCSQYITRRTA